MFRQFSLFSGLLALAGVCAVAVRAEPLAPNEREKVLERLEQITQQAGQQKASKLKVAVTAFRKALQTNEEVMDLYLQCYEKVRYEEQNRPSIEFREWKRQQRDHLTEATFRLGLRHQLNWLLLGLEMNEKELTPGLIADRAAAALKSCAEDAPKLGRNAGVLKEDAFHSVFAQAYGVSHLAPKLLPGSPLPAGPVFDAIILPPLRSAADATRLETAWTTRLEMEINQIRLEAGDKSPEAEARLDKFTTEQRPQLVWNMLTDIFKAGGQRAAAPRMLTFLETNLSDRRAIGWTKEMKGMFETSALTQAEPASESPGQKAMEQ